MAFANSNDYLTGRKPVVSADSFGTCALRFSLAMVAGDLTLNNVGNIGILPAGCVPVGLLVDSDDLDTNASPTVAFAIGMSNAAVSNNVQGATPTDISTAAADGGAAWATAITVGQAGGQVQPLSKALSRVQAVNYDRYIVLKATTAAATGAAGEFGVTLLYRAV